MSVVISNSAQVCHRSLIWLGFGWDKAATQRTRYESMCEYKLGGQPWPSG